MPNRHSPLGVAPVAVLSGHQERVTAAPRTPPPPTPRNIRLEIKQWDASTTYRCMSSPETCPRSGGLTAITGSFQPRALQ